MKSWCIPRASARFVANMEDVLSVYQRPYDPKRPQVCVRPRRTKCELSVLKRQCLKSRLPDIDTVAEKAAAWVKHRNHVQTGIDRRFTSEDARIKLKRLFPIVNDP